MMKIVIGQPVMVGDVQLNVATYVFATYMGTESRTLGLHLVLDAEEVMAFDLDGFGGPHICGVSISAPHRPYGGIDGQPAVCPDTKAMMAQVGQYMKVNRRGQRGLFAIDEANANWLFGSVGCELVAVQGRMPSFASNLVGGAKFAVVVGEFDTKASHREGWLGLYNAKNSGAVVETAWRCLLDGEVTFGVA